MPRKAKRITRECQVSNMRARIISTGITSWVDTLPEELIRLIWQMVNSQIVVPKIVSYGLYKINAQALITNTLFDKSYYYMAVGARKAKYEVELNFELKSNGEVIAGDMMLYSSGEFVPESGRRLDVNNRMIHHSINVLSDVNNGHTCGIFNPNIINTSLKMFMLVRRLSSEWHYLGYSNGTMQATKYSRSVFADGVHTNAELAEIYSTMSGVNTCGIEHSTEYLMQRLLTF